jgi:hypothetical protein
MMSGVFNKKLYGFCEGCFGRDSYDDKTIEGIGEDWIVARQTDGLVVIARFDTQAHRDDAIRRFSKKPSECGEYDEG